MCSRICHKSKQLKIPHHGLHSECIPPYLSAVQHPKLSADTRSLSYRFLTYQVEMSSHESLLSCRVLARREHSILWMEVCYNCSILVLFAHSIGEFPYISGSQFEWWSMDIVKHKREDGDLAALLCALSFATGLGFGGHMEHGLRSAYLGLQIADELMLASEEREAIFYGALLKDVACTACSAGIAAFLPEEDQVSLSDVILVDPSRFSDMIGWLSKYLRMDAHFPARIAKLLSFMVQCGPVVKETMRSHCEVAELFARHLGFPDYVQRTLRFQWERWDGKGMAYRLKGPTIPRTARILHLAQVLELMYRFGGPA